MFCSRCGKKVMDDMLFCPFCGTKLIIPKQDGASGNGIQTGQGILNRVEETASHETVEPFSRDLSGTSDGLAESLTDTKAELGLSNDGEAQSFPDAIQTEEDFFKPVKQQPQASTVADTFAEFERAHVPSASDGTENKLPEMERVGDWSEYLDDKAGEDADDAKNAAGSTIEPFQRAPRAQADGAWNESRIEPFQRAGGSDKSTPNKSVVPDDMFMDDDDDYDAFDDEEDEQPKRGRKRARSSRDYEDDDDIPNSFFMRHIRSIVGLLLFFMLLVIVALYALSDQGQTQLARINATLPLNPKVYAKLGREYYDAKDYTQSSLYFERALAREPRNYDYAQSAVMAYLADGNVDKAVEMLKRCVSINPKAIEPYLYLQNLYPDENTRPWEIAQLLQKGYEQTGDERLSID